MFHSQCDGKGPSVTLIKLATNKLIGGYASVSWNTKSAYFGDKNSFLFSLTNNFKHEYIKTSYYLYGVSSCGPTWGGAHDLRVGYNSHFSYGATCNPGYTYKCRTGTYNSTTCRNDFCGSASPGITDVEVWIKK